VPVPVLVPMLTVKTAQAVASSALAAGIVAPLPV
jgi:hypothetical protein